VAAASERASQGYLVLAGSALLIALLLALAASRSITRPLRELTDAAGELAGDRLPQLVDALRNPVDDDEHYLTATMEPITVRSDDELGQLAQAFNAVQTVAVDVAAEQATLLRKGISELYINLARRNQSLLDRQIQHLDKLERDEQDPEVLEHLYLLDHLATRMRRNAESLLVLAGAESGPRRTKSAPVIDAVRAAVSEVEEYERVDLGSLADATLHGPAVSDVAHLIAELIENATQFSPPETMVRVDGARTGGSYQLVITDQGVGIRPEQLEQLNAVLRDPPVTGLALGRSLGCLVAARLAARHGITVRLRAGEDEGVAAYVTLPRDLLIEDPVEAPTPAPPPPATITVAADRVDPQPPAERLEEAIPASDLEAGLQALLEEEALEEPVIEIEPAVLAATASSLVRRVPGATAEALPEPHDEPPVRRSPDEVRELLSRYRSGLRAGRDPDGPSDEERS
jgi:signal transduction histidine kinase